MSYNFDKDQNHYFFKNNKSIPLVFIHGVGLNQGMWKPQINYFKDETLLTYDLLGHGKTKYNKNTLKIEDFRFQLKSLLVNLNIQKINLVGFSIGALIAIDFASEHKKYLNSLTLIATTYKRTDEERQKVIDRLNLAKKNMPISKLAMKRWFSDKYLENNPTIYKEFMNILNKSGEDHENFIKAYDLFANYVDDETKVKKIDTNTLILTGSDDPGSTSKMSKELNNDIPNSKFIEIKGGKHLCSIEFADDVNNAIKEHIKNEQN